MARPVMTIIGILLLCAAFSLALIAAVVRARQDNTKADYALCILSGTLFSVVTSYGRAEWLSVIMGVLGTSMALMVMHGLAYVLTSLRRVRPPTE